MSTLSTRIGAPLLAFALLLPAFSQAADTHHDVVIVGAGAAVVFTAPRSTNPTSRSPPRNSARTTTASTSICLLIPRP